jgi:ribulose-5-phosphate 4-epimerase/fuculose-1-phosphate aldolase
MGLDGKPVPDRKATTKLSKRLAATLQLPLEVFLHAEIYRARPEVQAICRFHGMFANVLSVLRRTLRPVHELAVPIGREVPLFDTPELISSPSVGRRMVSALGSARALLLRGNGQLTVGTNREAAIEEAAVNAILLETTAEMQWRALAVGEPSWIGGDELSGEFAKLANREYEAILRPWEYYLHQSQGK